jgi:hypothetical protein
MRCDFDQRGVRQGKIRCDIIDQWCDDAIATDVMVAVNGGGLARSNKPRSV